MNKVEEKFLKKAIALALDNVQKLRGGPFGAVIVKEGEIIAEGFNTVTSKNDPTAHAEIEAIREACQKLGTYKLEGCDIYVSCEPCPMCLAAVYWARLNRVIYASGKHEAAEAGFDDNLIYQEISREPYLRSVQMVHIDLVEAMHVFEEWKKNVDKIPY